MVVRRRKWNPEPMRASVLLLAAMVALAAGCGLGGPDRPGKRPSASLDHALLWPARGAVSSGFGPRGNAHHDGIDIAAPEGTPVRAALDGVVIFEGSLRGYGKVVILSHPGGLTTVYAHNSRNRVKQGARVRRGTVIASLGRTGRTTGPNLHFEVRHNNVARDPIAYLPKRERSSQVAQQGTRRTGG